MTDSNLPAPDNAEVDGSDLSTPALDEADLAHLQRCVELAEEALLRGHQPFGSVLVGAGGEVLYEDRNREGAGDATQHPEFALARWAAQHCSEDERSAATVYTSGEHCPMCSAAHAWVGLGRIVFASSAEQTSRWYAEFGAPDSPVRPLPIKAVAPRIATVGPVEPFAGLVRDLHRRRFARELQRQHTP